MQRGERDEMAFTYTDSDKIVLEAWGKFRVTLLEAVEPGDLLSWYNTDNAYTVQFADESDSQRADCIAVEKGAAGDEITACLKAVLKTISTIATGGVVTRVYFAAADDFFGAPLYLGEDGKPESDEGSTYVQTVGKLLARDTILLDLDPEISVFQGGKIKFFSWGGVMTQAWHMYLNNDYTCYIGSSAANVLMIGTSAGKVEFRCGAHGAAINIDNDGLSTAYRIRITGILDFGASNSGTLKLPQKTDPVTCPEEGTLFYNATQDKLQFRTAASIEEVTSTIAKAC